MKNSVVRRGQLQTMEPIIIVVMIIIILAISSLLYFRLSSSGSAITTQNIHSQDDVLTLIKTSRMPELQCSTSESDSKNCIDLLKAEAFSKLLQSQRERMYYNPILGNTNITVSWIDGDMKIHQKQLYYSINSSHVTTTISYFTVSDPETKMNYLGWMRIDREMK